MFFRDGIIVIGHVIEDDDQHWQVRVVRRAVPALDECIFRTAPATETVFEGRPAGTRSFNEGLRIAAEELLSGDLWTCTGQVGAKSVSAGARSARGRARGQGAGSSD